MSVDSWIALAAAAIAVVALVRTELHQRSQAPGELQRRAVSHILDALDEVMATIEHADVRSPSSRDVSDVMQRFERQCKRWDPVLPTGACHVRVSTRQAMAHCFGGPASGAFDPEASTQALHPFNSYWWDIGVSYIEHARGRMGAWLTTERQSSMMITPYYQWRRDEDELHR